MIDELYTAVKLYLTQISREALDEPGRPPLGGHRSVHDQPRAGRRHHRARAARHRGKQDPARGSFSDAGMARDQRPARAPRRQPAPRDQRVPQRRPQERAGAARAEGHCSATSSGRTPTRIFGGWRATRRRASRRRSLHLDLISDFKRINSHFCSVAYPILEQAGVLSKTRVLGAPPAALDARRTPASRWIRQARAEHFAASTRTMALTLSEI